MGWVIVRDALGIGPWHHHTERSRTRTRSPTDHDADHVMLRLVECVQGSVEINLECEPAFDYGGLAADWSYSRTGIRGGGGELGGHRPRAAASDRPAPGLRGPAGAGPDDAARGRRRVRRAGLVDASGCRPATRRPKRGWHEPAASGRSGSSTASFPDHPWRTLSAAQRADAEGPHLRAIRSDDRGGHHVAAGDTGRRPQLGLPLQLDPRLDVHAVGAVHARLRRGGERLLLLRRRRGRGRGGAAPDHVRDRRREEARGAGARAPLRLRAARGRCGSATAPTTRTSTTCGARCSTRSTCTRARATSCPTACGRSSSARWRPRWIALARARPGDLGGPRRAQALHLVEADVLGGRRPRRAAGPDPRRRGDRVCAGRTPPTRSTPTSARTGSTPGRVRPALRHRRRSTPRCC